MLGSPAPQISADGNHNSIRTYFLQENVSDLFKTVLISLVSSITYDIGNKPAPALCKPVGWVVDI